jgi:hypothetical protein
MDNSFLNFIIFIVTTILYFLIKPTPPLIDDNNPTSNQSSSYMMLCAYFLVVLITQFFINSYIITTSCGGNVLSNLKEAALYTFMPWTLIFGVVIVSVIAYPDIKSAFSDVYGYYYVAGSANNIITDLLINVPSKDGSNTSNNIVEPNASISPSASPNSLVDVNQMGGSKSLQGGAATLEENRDLIVKICGNMSILINQIVPANFSYYWNTMLSPLFKDKYKNATDESSKNELLKKKEELYELVVSRDNIGEGMWYIYTGVLLCSLVQYKLSGVGCKSDQKTLEANYTKFRDDKAAAEKAKASALATSNPQ